MKAIYLIFILSFTLNLGSTVNTSSSQSIKTIIKYKRVYIEPNKIDSVINARKRINDSIDKITYDINRKVELVKQQQKIIKNEKDTTRNR